MGVIQTKRYASYPFIGIPTTQASSTVQASPAPTTTSFSVATGMGKYFDRGEAYWAGKSIYIDSVATDAITAHPMSGVPAAGDVIEQDVPQYLLPVTAGPYTSQEIQTGDLNDTQSVTIINSATGSFTMNFEGTDGDVDASGNIVWIPIPYIVVATSGAGINSTRTFTTANPTMTGIGWARYQLQDLYGTFRYRITGVTPPISVLGRLSGSTS
jgi:hypothetical protein